MGIRLTQQVYEIDPQFGVDSGVLIPEGTREIRVDYNKSGEPTVTFNPRDVVLPLAESRKVIRELEEYFKEMRDLADDIPF